ncbi:MAG: hypothetical protein Kow0067_10860 [Coriobacteriia bacterium]
MDCARESSLVEEELELELVLVDVRAEVQLFVTAEARLTGVAVFTDAAVRSTVRESERIFTGSESSVVNLAETLTRWAADAL